MRCMLCRYMWGLMRCRLCREDYEMEAVKGYWGDVLGDGRGILVHYI